MIHLTRRVMQRGSVSVMGIFAAIFMTSITSPAVASADEKDHGLADSPIDTYCAQTYVEKAPGQPGAVRTHKVCGSTEQEARAKLPADAPSTLLAQLFENPIGEAGLRTDIYADSFCDPAGWGFSDLEDANDAVRGVTHIKTFNGCNGGELYTETDYENLCNRFSCTYEFNLPGGCNDRLLSMRLYNFPAAR